LDKQAKKNHTPNSKDKQPKGSMQDSALLQNIINQSIFSYKFDVPKNKMKKTKLNNRLNSEYTGDDHASNYKDIMNNISK
jgi:hypothetical protein